MSHSLCRSHKILYILQALLPSTTLQNSNKDKDKCGEDYNYLSLVWKINDHEKLCLTWSDMHYCKHHHVCIMYHNNVCFQSSLLCNNTHRPWTVNSWFFRPTCRYFTRIWTVLLLMNDYFWSTCLLCMHIIPNQTASDVLRDGNAGLLNRGTDCTEQLQNVSLRFTY